MIDGDPHEFLKSIAFGQDTVYVYHGIKYWFQGYITSEGKWHMETYQYEPYDDDWFWSYDCDPGEDDVKVFVEAPIFEGKTFWEVEQDIQWVDY